MYQNYQSLYLILYYKLTEDIFGDNGTKEKTSQETQQQIETDVQG